MGPPPRRWETHFDDLVRDIEYALRTLLKDRRFSLIAILALALGIGASTIVFSVVYNVFFHALPYKDYGRSVVLTMENLASFGEAKVRRYFSLAEVRAFREHNHVFEETITFARMRPTYDDGKSIRFFPLGATVSTKYVWLPRCLGAAGPYDHGGGWKPQCPAGIRNELPLLAEGIRRRSENPW